VIGWPRLLTLSYLILSSLLWSDLVWSSLELSCFVFSSLYFSLIICFFNSLRRSILFASIFVFAPLSSVLFCSVFTFLSLSPCLYFSCLVFALSCLVLSRRTSSFPASSCLTYRLSCLVFPCLLLPCHVLHYLFSCFILLSRLVLLETVSSLLKLEPFNIQLLRKRIILCESMKGLRLSLPLFLFAYLVFGLCH
jgi:hypothetical protein